MKVTILILCIFALLTSVAKAQQPCDICTMAVTYAESYLRGSNMTASQIESELVHVCSELPNKIAVAECTGIVQKYLSVIIEQLTNGTDPNAVCSMVDLCNTTQPDWGCIGCQAAVFVAEEYFKANGTTSADILAALKNLCTKLPKDVQTECKIAVTLTGPLIVKKLLAMDDPRDVCLSLKLCKSAAPALRLIGVKVE